MAPLLKSSWRNATPRGPPSTASSTAPRSSSKVLALATTGQRNGRKDGRRAVILLVGGSAGQRQCLAPAVKRLEVVGHALEERARTLHGTRAKHHRQNAQRRSVPRNIEKGRGVIHGAANGSINCLLYMLCEERRDARVNVCGTRVPGTSKF